MRYAGEFAALGTAVCFAVAANLFAAAGARMGSAALNRLRILTALALLTVTLTVVRGVPWPVWATGSQLGWLTLSGLVGFTFGDANYFRALVILGPGRAALLMSLAPVFTALLAWPVLGEMPGPLALLGMALTLGGIMWVIHAREPGGTPHVEGSVALGVFAGVLGAIGQAGGSVLSKLALRSGIDPLSATVVRVAAGAAGIWLLTGAQGQVSRTLDTLRDRRAALFMACGALFGPFLGVTFSLVSLKYIEAGVAASITASYPLIAIAIAARFHGERLGARIVIGALVTVAGVVVLFMR
jgi:drug/metabolite transporter (DMT)-like permease